MKTVQKVCSSRETGFLTNRPGVRRKFRSATLNGLRICRSLAKKTLWALCLLSISATVWAQKPDDDLTTKSLEELMNIQVTSVSKKEEKLFETAAAIYVITQEEIRRSGLTSIPELLRLVPGLSVARIDGNKWAITARGFNGRFTNKLLVLIDGRTIYSPTFSGVFWEAQDVLVEDIERIEVIRGPGGTLWGANAVNGVINIITKRAAETQGGLVTAGSGSEERGFGSLRYGGKIGENAHYRAYAKYFNRDGLAQASGLDANDGQDAFRGGGRIDWQLSERDLLTLQGDIYNSRLRETPTIVSLAAPFAPPVNLRGEISGGNVLGRWNRVFSERSDMALQFYYDRAVRNMFDLSDSVDTFDIDFQHHLAVRKRQDVVWGLGYRIISDRFNANSLARVEFVPKSRTVQLFSAFAQDELTLVKDKLRLTMGTKIEHNDYTGFEIQPSARLLWTPSERQTVWGAVSRAVRTPSRVEDGLKVNIAAFPGPDGLLNLLTLSGSPNFRSEELLAYEAGYRMQSRRGFSLDITTFYNTYDRLESLEQETPFFNISPIPHLVIPLRFGNFINGETYGLEASANWNISSRWKLQGSYSHLRLRLHNERGDVLNEAENIEGSNPRHQFQIRSYINLPRNLELDGALYRVSQLTAQQIPGYTRLDVRFGGQPREGVSLSLGLQNLLDRQHPEFRGVEISVIPSQVRRSIYGKLTWRF